MGVLVRLSEHDLDRVQGWSERRCRAAMRRGRRQSYGLDVDEGFTPERLAKDRMGIAGEYAVAISLGKPDDWEPNFEPDYQGDVDEWHVRATDYPDGHLVTHRRKDPDDQQFLLAVVLYPWVELAGWLWGNEAKRERYWRTNIRHPAFMAPQRALRPFLP